jgi:sugar lactone lactonase YvrE
MAQDGNGEIYVLGNRTGRAVGTGGFILGWSRAPSFEPEPSNGPPRLVSDPTGTARFGHPAARWPDILATNTQRIMGIRDPRNALVGGSHASNSVVPLHRVRNSLSGTHAGAGQARTAFPPTIHLPDGFHPEGIANGGGNLVYVAEFDNGAVFRADVRTGKGSILVPPQSGRQGIGIKLDGRTNLLFVCGGTTGHGYVYDAATGASIADFTLATGATFINDVVLTEDGAFFTDSFQPALYRLPLGKHGELPAPGAVQTLPLTGDFQFVPGQFNTNGIEVTPNGDQLIIVNDVTGKLYRVDPDTGLTAEIDLGGGAVVNGDGLVLRGHTLFVVENFTNRVDVVTLSPHLDRGRIVQVITDPRFDVPATAVLLGDALYVTNARFTTPVTPTTPYTVERVRAR